MRVHIAVDGAGAWRTTIAADAVPSIVWKSAREPYVVQING